MVRHVKRRCANVLVRKCARLTLTRVRRGSGRGLPRKNKGSN